MVLCSKDNKLSDTLSYKLERKRFDMHQIVL